MFFSERYNIRMLQNHRTYIKPQLCTVNKGCACTVPVYFRFFVAKNIHLGLYIELNHLGVSDAT